jgi:glycosyltransferase involved in cell wall biosynthesis
MSDTILSIIIPIYKVEKYLHKCIDSILSGLNSQESEYEIILVDDGSPDNCPAICDDYDSKYKHITAIHKENGGQSDARNCGINVAKGEYLTFVDSDDYVNSEISKIISLIKNNKGIDIFQTGMTKVYSSEKKNKDVFNKINGLFELNKDKNFHQVVRQSHVSAILKILRRDFILSNNLLFKKNRILEDFEWSIRAWVNVQSIYLTSINYYFYLQHDASTMHNFSLKIIKDCLSNTLDNQLYITNSSLSNFEKQQYLALLSKNLLVYVKSSARKLNKNDFESALELIEKNKHLFMHQERFKDKILILQMKIFGIKNSLKILRQNYVFRNYIKTIFSQKK